MADQIARVDLSSARELVALWNLTFRQAYSDVHSAANIEQYCAATFTMPRALATLSDENTVCSFYYRNDKPIGYYVVIHQECPLAQTGKSSELKQIYILADAYGSGVGRALFEDSCEVVRSTNRHSIWLAVSDLNQRARSFYDKAGFQRLGAGPIFEVGTDRLESTIMVRKV